MQGKKHIMIEYDFPRIQTFVFVIQPGGILCLMTSYPWPSVTSHPHTFTHMWYPPSGNNTHIHIKTLPEMGGREE